MTQPGQRHGRPCVIGLTGGIATGKTQVFGMLLSRGGCGIDADSVYHELIKPGEPLWAALRTEFGASIIDAKGEIDRRRLGDLVFGDAKLLAKLDALTHPAVVSAVRERLRTLACEVVVIDAVKLFESGLARDCDETWLVTAKPEQQIDRLIHRNHLSRKAAADRVQAQTDPDRHRRLVDVIIDNSGSLASTESQVAAAWNRLTAAAIRL